MVARHLLSTYLPSCCILIIAQVIIYFKKEHFKTSIPVGITAMLVMYTLNNSISAKLPLTSYVKFIDVWLLFGLIQPFFSIVLIIILEHIPDNTDSVKQFAAKMSDKTLMAMYQLHKYFRFLGRVINPIWQSLFVSSYVAIAVVLYFF